MKNNILEERSDIFNIYSKATSQVMFKVMLEQRKSFIDMKISRPQ